MINYRQKPKTFQYKMAFLVDFALFFRTIDGLLRESTLGYDTVRLKNSDKFALPTVLKMKDSTFSAEKRSGFKILKSQKIEC
jgi:hypothetical protein